MIGQRKVNLAEVVADELEKLTLDKTLKCKNEFVLVTIAVSRFIDDYLHVKEDMSDQTLREYLKEFRGQVRKMMNNGTLDPNTRKVDLG